MAKSIIFTDEVKQKISEGITKLANAVKVTLGPSGKVVMIEKQDGSAFMTKDGVTVAKHIHLKDKPENMGAYMVKQVASKTAGVAGDGTTTATIYAEAIYKMGLKALLHERNPLELKKGIDKAVDFIVEFLKEHAKPVINNDTIAQVARCSANQDEKIGNIIAEAIDKVGKDGAVTIEEGQTLEDYIRIVDGYQFNQGFISGYFINNQSKMNCEYKNPYVFVTNDRITNIKPILPLLEQIAKSPEKRPLVIIAEDVSGQALSSLINNMMKGVFQVVCVRAPEFGDRRKYMLEDIATTLGAKFYDSAINNLNEATINDCGSCDRIVCDGDVTTIYDGHGSPDDIAARIEAVKSQLEVTVLDFDREKLQSRLAKLVGSVAQIVVGGAMEAEIREKKDRVEDALHACRAALQEGILPGGGIVMMRASERLGKLEFDNDDQKAGIDIIRKAVVEPLRQIARNTYIAPDVIINEVKDKPFDYGYNASAREFGNMYEFGVIVPTKVERVALLNASSIASLLLSTDCVVHNDEDEVEIPNPMI